MLGWRGLLGSTGLDGLGGLIVVAVGEKLVLVGEGLVVVAVGEGLIAVEEWLVVVVVDAVGRKLLLGAELLPCLVVLVPSTWTRRGLCWTCWP